MLLANENIEILDSLLLSAVSMGIIMAILFMIMMLIYLMSWAYRQFKKKQAERAGKKPVTAEAPAVTEAPSAVAETLAPGSCGELKLVKTSDAEAAMIMAIIADNLKEDLNTLRFKEIRLVGSDDGNAAEK